MAALISALDRSRSVSSMRRMKAPSCWRANNQLKSAVRAPPTCRNPVGEGAKRTRTRAGVVMAAQARQSHLRASTLLASARELKLGLRLRKGASLQFALGALLE